MLRWHIALLKSGLLRHLAREPRLRNFIYVECACSDFVDVNGYGRCRQRDVTFHAVWPNIERSYNPFTCYVDDFTYCSDLQESTTTADSGKLKSAVACEGRCHI